jgi:hypothetical protein
MVRADFDISTYLAFLAVNVLDFFGESRVGLNDA